MISNKIHVGLMP